MPQCDTARDQLPGTVQHLRAVPISAGGQSGLENVRSFRGHINLIGPFDPRGITLQDRAVLIMQVHGPSSLIYAPQRLFADSGCIAAAWAT